ncbi:MAG: DUF637 domain-containing protein [Rhodocyclaceae bacterium]
MIFRPQFNSDYRGPSPVVRSLLSAGVSTAIQGGSFGEALRDSLVGDLAAMGAGAIGSQWGSGPNKNVALLTLAHAGWAVPPPQGATRIAPSAPWAGRRRVCSGV